MYKRIPATYFDEFKDVYFSMISFMQECGFTIIDNNAIGLFTDTIHIENVYVMQDPNTIHKLCLVFFNKGNSYVSDENPNVTLTTPDSGGRVCLFVFDEYDNTKYIHEQVGIVNRWGNDMSTFGVGLCDSTTSNDQRRDRCDLICIYNNKSLIFIYVPTNCYIYSHIYNYSRPNGGHMLFYGNFTKYHIGYDNDVVFLFGTMLSVEAGILDSYLSPSDFNYVSITADPHPTDAQYVNIFGLLYCSPEASHTIGGNRWFATYEPRDGVINMNIGKNPPLLLTSFDRAQYTDIFQVPYYFRLWQNSFARCKNNLSSTLNNTSVLLPMIIYGMREPRILRNWSAIGETKLVNLIDMSHMNSGEVFIDTSIERDYHKYLVFPALLDYKSTHQSFLGIAVEIWAKEDLLNNQDLIKNIIWLNDTYRNFDRLEVVYEDNGITYNVGWTYDELNQLFDSDGIFNFTKDEEHSCMVYGLRYEGGGSLEYKLVYRESCKINSITGYRE